MNYIVQAVILVYFVGMFALGILGEQRTKNTADYYVAGRQVNGFFAGIVYTTSLVSAGALVGWVSQAWQWGIYFIYAASAVTVATFLCWWLLGRKLCTCSRDLNLFTVPDFLEKRFESRTARLIASLLIITFSGKNQVLNAHNFSLLVLSNFDKPTQPPSCPMVGSLCIFLFSSPCSALLTPSPYECPLCWFLPVTRSVRSLAGTPGT